MKVNKSDTNQPIMPQTVAMNRPIATFSITPYSIQNSLNDHLAHIRHRMIDVIMPSE